MPEPNRVPKLGDTASTWAPGPTHSRYTLAKNCVDRIDSTLASAACDPGWPGPAGAAGWLAWTPAETSLANCRSDCHAVLAADATRSARLCSRCTASTLTVLDSTVDRATDSTTTISNRVAAAVAVRRAP